MPTLASPPLRGLVGMGLRRPHAGPPWRRAFWKLIDAAGLGLVYVYTRLWHRWSSNGWAPLPASGAALLVANHTCSADPAFLTSGSPRVLGYVLAREFYLLPVVKRLFDYLHCVPARRNGRDFTSLRVALRRLSAGHVLCIFPEGGLSTAGVRMRPGKAGVALLALRSRAPVFPAHIAGGPQTSNVVGAWLFPSRRPVRVLYGPAVDLSAYYGRRITRRLLEEVTSLLMRRIAELPKTEE